MLHNPPTLEQLAFKTLATTFSHPGMVNAMIANSSALHVFLTTLDRSSSTTLFVSSLPLLLELLSNATFGEDAARMLWIFSWHNRATLKPMVEAYGITKLMGASISENPSVQAHAILILCNMVYVAEEQERIEDQNNNILWTAFAKPFVGPPAFIKAAKGIVLIDFIKPLTALLSNPRFQKDAASALLSVTRRIGSSAITLMLHEGVIAQLQAQLTPTSDAYFISSAICILSDISNSSHGRAEIRSSRLVPTLQEISRQLVDSTDWTLKELVLTPLLQTLLPTNSTWLGWLSGRDSAADHPEARP